MPEATLFLLRLLSIPFLLGRCQYKAPVRQQSLDQASESSITISKSLSLAYTHNGTSASPSTNGPHAMVENSIEQWGSILSNKEFCPLSQGRHIHPRSIVDGPTKLPAPFNSYPDGLGWSQNYQNILSGYCTIEDPFCFFKASNGSMVKANGTELYEDCVLWDDSCSGNRTAAIEKFFDAALRTNNTNNIGSGPLLRNNCFQQLFVNVSDCDTYNPPERLTEFLKIKNWMRSSQCVSAADEWIAMTGYDWGEYFSTGNETKAEYIHDQGNSSVVLPSCCGLCLVYAENVDLYYWPEPDSDTSCLSIIGSVRPIDFGATTQSDTTYWACNWTQSSTTGILTTAQITTVGPLTVKVSSYNPWSSSPCDVDEPGSKNQSIKAHDGFASVHKRAHSLIIPTAMTQADGLPISTLVSGQFTL